LFGWQMNLATFNLQPALVNIERADCFFDTPQVG